MKMFDPHIHMTSRTTDDYVAMAEAGIMAIVEPAFWLGQPRTSAGAFEDYFNSEGVEVLQDGTPSLNLPEGPDMITGEAGDLVLAHHQIIHTGGPNASPNIRYAAIARLRHVDCEENGNDGFTDIWREYPGVRAVVGSG